MTARALLEAAQAMLEYSRIREEFEHVARLGNAASIPSAMLNVDSLIRAIASSLEGQADSERLDWLDANEAGITYWHEAIDDDEHFIWCNVVKGDMSLSGHPLSSAREAIDAARAAQSEDKPA